MNAPDDPRHDSRADETPTAAFSDEQSEQRDRNPDPITGQPGAHPVGTGVGAAGAGATGAAIGTAVAGPVGGVVGAVIGAVAGGYAGKASRSRWTRPQRTPTGGMRTAVSPISAMATTTTRITLPLTARATPATRNAERRTPTLPRRSPDCGTNTSATAARPS